MGQIDECGWCGGTGVVREVNTTLVDDEQKAEMSRQVATFIQDPTGEIREKRELLNSLLKAAIQGEGGIER